MFLDTQKFNIDSLKLNENIHGFQVRISFFWGETSWFLPVGGTTSFFQRDGWEIGYIWIHLKTSQTKLDPI